MSYNQTIKKSLPAFVLGRLTPTMGISAVFLLVAHKSPEDLAVFSYVLAAASVISVFFSLVLATVGNKAASLAHNALALRDLFTGGFTLALCLAMLNFLVCLLTTYLISRTNSPQQMDTEVYWTLSLVYISSTPLLVINGFLQLFLEATGKASGCSKVKTLITVFCSGFLAVIFAAVSRPDFTRYAMCYFFITELLTLIFLIRLSGDQRYYSWTHAKENCIYFVRTGIPVAVGLSGQKLYFYLLTERLARIDAHLVAELSVFMTVIGLLIIPSVALAQIHSLQVSRHIEYSRTYYRAGLTWLFGMVLLISLIMYFFGEYAFVGIGGYVVDYSTRLTLTLIMFLTSSSLLSLALAHLRARNETFVPQLLINVIMLVFLTPLLYTIEFNTPDLENFLMLQSTAAFIGFIALWARIVVVHRRVTTYPPEKMPTPETQSV